MLSHFRDEMIGRVADETSRVYPFRRLNQLRMEETDSRFILSQEQTVVGASG